MEKYKAKKSSDHLPPLHFAAKCFNPDIVRFLLPFFNVNQEDSIGLTPLCYAARADTREARPNTRSLETCQVLLENGANITQGGANEFYPQPPGALLEAVRTDNTKVVALLLQHGADPNLNRRPVNEELHKQGGRCTDFAIEKGNEEILRMLLEHGAFVGVAYQGYATSLYRLLRNQHAFPRSLRLSITRILVNHAANEHGTLLCLQETLEGVAKISTWKNDICEIILEAGVHPSSRALHVAIGYNNEPACRLLVQCGADPFLERDEHDVVDGNNAFFSPFHVAARLPDLGILRLFLAHWYERFSSASGGKNEHGDAPIHVLLRADPLLVQNSNVNFVDFFRRHWISKISIQVIKLLVDEYEANVSETTTASINGRCMIFYHSTWQS